MWEKWENFMGPLRTVEKAREPYGITAVRAMRALTDAVQRRLR
jgi:hypothetical protein